MIHTCDFCGDKKEVVTTSYGTTHYKRLICKDCIKNINARNYELVGWEKTINEDGSLVKGVLRAC